MTRNVERSIIDAVSAFDSALNELLDTIADLEERVDRLEALHERRDAEIDDLSERVSDIENGVQA